MTSQTSGKPQMGKRTSRDIRKDSRLAVLRGVYTGQPVTRQELAADTGLSFATVSSIVAELLETGVLSEVAYEDSGGGRPRARLAVNADRGVLVGVDVAETWIKVDLYDLALGARGHSQRSLHPDDPHHNSPRDVIEHVAREVQAVLSLAEVEPAQVLGVGVSLPGLVSRTTGVSVFAPNWSWHDEPVLATLADRLALPVYLDNPIKAATVAELWFGAGRAARSLVTIFIGTGVGAGISLGGELLRGATNSAGEWGHNTLVMDGRPCRCGGRGCIEAYVGNPGIVQQMRELPPADRLIRPDPDDATGRPVDYTATLSALAAALRDGDPSAAKVISETARYLGAGLAGLVNIFNPDIVVLDGGVVDKLGEWLVPAARAATAAHALARPLSVVSIECSAIAQNSVTLGMATFALEGFLGVNSADTY
jgi:predicted NBD/HSP70 family sugar kinase